MILKNYIQSKNTKSHPIINNEGVLLKFLYGSQFKTEFAYENLMKYIELLIDYEQI